MKKLLGNSLTLISEIIILVLAGIWFYSSREIEPIIVGVIAFTAILLGIFFRNQEATPVANPTTVTSSNNSDSNSTFKANDLKAKKNIGGKITQRNGKIELEKIESKEGGIKFDIDQA